MGAHSKIALGWMSQNLTNESTVLVQVRLGALSQQVITWTNVDPDLSRHMASLGYNELIKHMVCNLLNHLGKWKDMALS